MGQLFDRMTAGLPPNPNRAANWIAVGSGLSQLAQGGPVDLSQHHARIQQRNDQQEERKGLTGAIESLKEELGPERYKALLGAPPAIQKAIIAKWYEQQFAPQDPWANAKVVGNRVLRMGDAGVETIYDATPPPAPGNDYERYAARERANDRVPEGEFEYRRRVAEAGREPGDPAPAYASMTGQEAAAAGIITPQQIPLWNASGLKERGEYVKTQLVPGESKTSADEEDIALMEETGLTREQAIMALKRYKIDRDPLTRNVQIVDIATGEVIEKIGSDQPSPSAPAVAPVSGGQFGEPYRGADSAFGAEGFVKRKINTIADAFGGRIPFEDTMQAQSDVAVLGESLLSAFAAGYKRQPPSWVLENIDKLIPEAGRVWEGREGAKKELTSLARDFMARRQVYAESLERELAPDTRAEAMNMIAGIDAAMAELNAVLQQLDGGQSKSERGGTRGSTSGNVQWRVVE